VFRSVAILFTLTDSFVIRLDSIVAGRAIPVD